MAGFKGAGAFEECRSLTSAVLHPSLELLEASTFASAHPRRALHTPVAPHAVRFTRRSLHTGFALRGPLQWRGWSQFFLYTDVRSMLMVLWRGSKARCESLTNIVVPNTVTMIGNYTFEGCSALKVVAGMQGVLSIGTVGAPRGVAPRGSLHEGRSTRVAPREALHVGVADRFYTDVCSILMFLWLHFKRYGSFLRCAFFDRHSLSRRACCHWRVRLL